MPSRQAPGNAQKRLVLAIVGAILTLSLKGYRFAAVQPVQIDAFIPACATAMFVNDTITAVLHFS